MKRTIGFVGTLLLLVGLCPVSVWAQDSVPRVIPYHGYLEMDGLAVDGDVELRFELGYEGGTAWAEEHWADDIVTVSQGHFLVLLGSIVDIPDAFFEENELELVISEGVSTCEEGGGCMFSWSPLEPDQVIVPTPYSLWTTGGSDFDVQGDLTVAGSIDATTVTLGGNIRAVQDNGPGGVFTVSGDTAVVSGASIAGTGNSSSLNTTDLETDAVLTVGTDLTVGGEIYFDAIDGTGDGGLVVSHAASDTLVFGSGLSTSVDVDSALEFNGATLDVLYTTDVGGNMTANEWTVNGGRALMHRFYHDDGQGDGLYTFSSSSGGGPGNYNIEKWVCWPGSVRILDADICEGSGCNSLAIYANYTYFHNGSTSWRGYSNFRTHGSGNRDVPDIEMAYVCIQRQVVGLVCNTSSSYVCSPSSSNAGASCASDGSCSGGYCEPDWTTNLTISSRAGTGCTSNGWYGNPP